MSEVVYDLNDIKNRLSALQRLVFLLISKYQAQTNKKSKQELLWQYARAELGRDASPLDFVGDELGCAESVSQIISKVIKFPIITGTWSLNHRMANDNRFIKASEDSGAGTIIIAATGTGNGKIRGHVGILYMGKKIMSSNSQNGIWTINYDIESWKRRWEKYGGFKTHYYIIK